MSYSANSDDLRLPPGSRLLHIGPFKTGTSALQGAFSQARDALAEQGVIYAAGPGLRHWLRPTIALTGTQSIRGHPKAEPRHWQQLVDAFERAEDNTVLHSCEYFSDCEPEYIERTVRELGGAHPMHIVVTVRPLSKIVPSQWQMHIQGGWIHTPYETWLRQVFDDAPIGANDPTARFWHRHDHAQLAARWAEVVGPSNVTVIVADPKDRHALLRPFDEMLGLPKGFLEFEPGHVNESLPYSTIELLRRINREFDERGWTDADYGRLIRNGATARMHADYASLPAESPIHTPAWAQERITEIGERIADHFVELAETGVRVVGDIDNLRAGARSSSGGTQPASGESTPITVDAAGLFASGILGSYQERRAELETAVANARERTKRLEAELAEEKRAIAQRGKAVPQSENKLEHRRVIDVGSATLLRLLVRRVVRKVRRLRPAARTST